MDGFARVLDGTCDYFFTLGGQILWETNGRYCNSLSVVGAPFFQTTVSILLPKQSNLTEPMSLATLRLREENQIMNSSQYANQFTCNVQSSSTIVSSAARRSASCAMLAVTPCEVPFELRGCCASTGIS
jgi:hypothetical protein